MKKTCWRFKEEFPFKKDEYTSIRFNEDASKLVIGNGEKVIDILMIEQINVKKKQSQLPYLKTKKKKLIN